MLPHNTQRDEIGARLDGLAVPEPRSNATHHILQAARSMPKKRTHFLNPLRQLRAWIYVPQMRYAIMAGVVGFFILLGLTSRSVPPSPTPASTQEMARITPDMIPDDLVLYDLEFEEYEPTIAL